MVWLKLSFTQKQDTIQDALSEAHYHMRRLGGTVCPHVLGGNAITGCYTVSYPFSKGKTSMLKTLKEGGFMWLFDIEERIVCLMQTSWYIVRELFFPTLYRHKAADQLYSSRCFHLRIRLGDQRAELDLASIVVRRYQSIQLMYLVVMKARHARQPTAAGTV